jgi:hypothetical protein
MRPEREDKWLMSYSVVVDVDVDVDVDGVRICL